MNERIEKLAIEAGYLKEFLDIGMPSNMEKFAESIVAECIRYIQYRTTDWDADLHWIFRDESGYMEVDIESLLQDHFGLSE